MTAEELDFCTRLYADANEIIASLDKKAIGDAVNWGDLHCIGIERVECFSPPNNVDIGWNVCISEASPSAYIFKEAVTQKLIERGYPSVSVVTEW